MVQKKGNEMSFKEQYKRAREIVDAAEWWDKNWKSKADFLNEKFPDIAAKGPTWSQRINASKKFLKDIEESLFTPPIQEESIDDET
jgi:hypothetical protein